MPNFNRKYDFVTSIKKEDPRAYEFLMSLAKLSNAKQDSEDFTQQYNSTMLKILELIDEKYRIDLETFENDKSKFLGQLSNLADTFKEGIGEGFKTSTAKDINLAQMFIKELIKRREYWSKQPRMPSETGANIAVWDFCITLDASAIDQNWYPALYQKRSNGQIYHQFHELISEFEDHVKNQKTEEIKR